MINLKETKRVKEAISKFPLSYENIIEDTDLGIAVTNEHGFFIAVNHHYCIVHNYSRQELLGTHFTLLLPAELKNASEINHAYFFKTKSSRLEKTEALTKDRTRIKLYSDSFYLTLPEQKPMKITFVAV